MLSVPLIAGDGMNGHEHNKPPLWSIERAMYGLRTGNSRYIVSVEEFERTSVPQHPSIVR